MASGADIARVLADIAHGDITAGDVRAVVRAGRSVLDRIMGQGPVDGQLVADVQRTREIYDHALDAIGGMDDGATIAPGSDAWRQAAGPVIVGACYGPPACSEAAVAQWGGMLPISPWGARPWVLAQASEALADARADALALLADDLAEGARDTAATVASAARSWVLPVAIAAGAYWYLTRE